MSFSVDGKLHKGILEILYGEDFPKLRRNRMLTSDSHGDINAYIVEVGTPEWTEKMTVEVPIAYYITQIVKPSKKYKREQKRKKIGLHIVK